MKNKNMSKILIFILFVILISIIYILNLHWRNNKTSFISIYQSYENINSYEDIEDKELEEIYSQKIAHKKVDGDFIIVQYQARKMDFNKKNDYQILKTEYLNKKQETLDEYYPLKIDYFWTWSDGYEDYYESEINLIDRIFNFFENKFSPYTNDKDRVKYYYLNKIVSIKDEDKGLWRSCVEVGSRRGFVMKALKETTSSNQPIINFEDKEGEPPYNPINYDFIEKKENFDNNKWLMEKAIDIYLSNKQAYVDIY